MKRILPCNSRNVFLLRQRALTWDKKLATCAELHSSNCSLVGRLISAPAIPHQSESLSDRGSSIGGVYSNYAATGLLIMREVSEVPLVTATVSVKVSLANFHTQNSCQVAHLISWLCGTNQVIKNALWFCWTKQTKKKRPLKLSMLFKVWINWRSPFKCTALEREVKDAAQCWTFHFQTFISCFNAEQRL